MAVRKREFSPLLITDGSAARDRKRARILRRPAAILLSGNNEIPLTLRPTREVLDVSQSSCDLIPGTKKRNR